MRSEIYVRRGVVFDRLIFNIFYVMFNYLFMILLFLDILLGYSKIWFCLVGYFNERGEIDFGENNGGYRCVCLEWGLNVFYIRYFEIS